jgi:hypothetical protein
MTRGLEGRRSVQLSYGRRIRVGRAPVGAGEPRLGSRSGRQSGPRRAEHPSPRQQGKSSPAGGRRQATGAVQHRYIKSVPQPSRLTVPAEVEWRGLRPDTARVPAEFRQPVRTVQRIGAPGFEPGTSCSQSRRATKLRHAPRLPKWCDLCTCAWFARRSASRHGDQPAARPLGRSRGRISIPVATGWVQPGARTLGRSKRPAAAAGVEHLWRRPRPPHPGSRGRMSACQAERQGRGQCPRDAAVDLPSLDGRSRTRQRLRRARGTAVRGAMQVDHVPNGWERRGSNC